MTHANAPLTPTGRLRMVHRHLHDGIPQAHVAAEFRVSRPTVATWVARYRAEGEAGLLDRPSRPRRSPAHTYLHSAIDGFTRLAYTEALEDERAATTVSFYCRARAFFAAHGITVDRVITDNGNNYRAADFTAKVVSLGGRHHRIRPYTPRHNGKVERYNRLMVDEVLYARPYTSETARREALAVWVNHYNYHRPHTSCGNAPPASLAPARVNNVMPSYS
ncbi:integrase core domain-containing protein [Micrococcus sp. 116]|uniref:integrase core domain-containing protein n=1 Tax=Micrococcus sp. 116 TaxID=2653154 RepID=UPI0012F2953E